MAENPGKETVYNLVNKVYKGHYVIPHFQRGYEWNPSMVCDLFESILQDYYAGLLLFWELDLEEAHKEMWDPVWGAPRSKRPSEAILDGQQRLASLYYAIYNPKRKFPNRKSYYQFFLNLDRVLNEDYDEAVFYKYSSRYHSLEELKQQKVQWIGEGILPLSFLSDRRYLHSNEFEGWLKEYLEKKQESGTVPKTISALHVSNILDKILDYEFVTNTLGRAREMRDVCSIFARINQMGMRLSTFDLMNAFLYPKGVALRKRWEALDNHQLKNIGSSMNEHLLRLMSLHKQGYCSSKYIYNLIPGEKTKKKDESGKIIEEVLVKSREEFGELWDKSCEYAEKARERIMNVGNQDFGAIKSEFIPNTTVLPVLGAIMWERAQNQSIRNIAESDFENTLVKWYWSAVFSEDYSGSSDTMMAMDFRDWKAWLMSEETKIRRIDKLVKDSLTREFNLIETKKGSSRYNAVLCLLALNNVKDFFTGRVLGTGDFSAESIHDHHIFPSRAKGFSPEKTKNFEKYKDSILNRTLLLDTTNKKEIKNRRPSQYLAKMKEKIGSKKIKEVMKTHLISEKALDYLWDDDFNNFIKEREGTILKRIRLILGIEKKSTEKNNSEGS